MNTILGTVWFLQLTDSSSDDSSDGQKSSTEVKESIEDAMASSFDLKDGYIAHGVIMILIPWSIFFFLIIVLVKVICFFWHEHKKRDTQMLRNAEIRNRYGNFKDEEQVDHETEAVIGVYFKIMDRVRYRSISGSEVDQSKNIENGIDYSYMVDQRQCRLCL